MNLKFKNKVHFSYLLILFIFFSVIAKAQDCKCPEANSFLDKYDLYLQKSKLDSAELALNEVKKMSSLDCQSVYYLDEAFLNFRKRDYDEAKKSLNTAYAILQKNGCPRQAYAKYYFTYSTMFSDMDQLDSAVYYSLEGIKIFEAYDMKQGMAYSYAGIAPIFGKMGQIDKAAYYLKKAIKICEELKDYFYVSQNYSMLATAYSSMLGNGQDKLYLDSMEYALNQSFLNAKKAKNLAILPRIYFSKSDIYFQKGDYKTAQLYIDSSINYPVKTMNEGSKASWYNRKAEINLITKNYDAALLNCDSSLKYGLFVKSVYEQIESYKTRFQILKAMGKFPEAIAAFEYKVKLSDSLNITEQSETINELEGRFNKVKNEKKINELSQQQKIDALQIRSLFAFVGLAVLIIIIIVFLYRQSVVRNKLKTIETEQRLNRARMDPHFFFNALASMQGLADNDSKRSELSNYISSFSKIMRQSLESTYIETVSLETEIEFLKNYMSLQKLRTRNKFDYTFEMDSELEINELFIPGMILQPFVENSIEHGFDGREEGGLITIKFEVKNKNILITIFDNGSGLKTDEKHKGYPSRATQIIKDRLFLLNKKYKTDASYTLAELPNKAGTKVEIILPIID